MDFVEVCVAGPSPHDTRFRMHRRGTWRLADPAAAAGSFAAASIARAAPRKPFAAALPSLGTPWQDAVAMRPGTACLP